MAAKRRRSTVARKVCHLEAQGLMFEGPRSTATRTEHTGRMDGDTAKRLKGRKRIFPAEFGKMADPLGCGRRSHRKLVHERRALLLPERPEAVACGPGARPKILVVIRHDDFGGWGCNLRDCLRNFSRGKVSDSMVCARGLLQQCV